MGLYFRKLREREGEQLQHQQEAERQLEQRRHRILVAVMLALLCLGAATVGVLLDHLQWH